MLTISVSMTDGSSMSWKLRDGVVDDVEMQKIYRFITLSTVDAVGMIQKRMGKRFVHHVTQGIIATEARDE